MDNPEGKLGHDAPRGAEGLVQHALRHEAGIFARPDTLEPAQGSAGAYHHQAHRAVIGDGGNVLAAPFFSPNAPQRGSRARR